jgi:DNA-binding Lrp family transcriptional regulator
MSELDPIDARIVQELTRDARIGNVALAACAGLSPSATLRRVQALERRGVIAGYRAVLSPQARGVGFTAYIAVGLAEHTRPVHAAFERAMSRATAVVECHNVTGTVEYLLRVEVADLAAYKSFHTDVLGALPMVRAITTYVVMDSAKDRT